MYFGRLNYERLKTNPNILVCPLNWGIGHATRCVPVIRELLEQGANVILGTSGRSQAFLLEEFPDLDQVNFPDYDVTYASSGKHMIFKMLSVSPSLFKSIRKEHKSLKKIIKLYNIHGVISDNRYGLYSKKIPTVFITHQVFIKTPWRLKFIEPVLFQLNKHYINKYDECWVPDFQGKPNLSGDLSHKKPLPTNYHFIGPLSRFLKESATSKSSEKYDLLVLLSGPEPQRTILENNILTQLESLDINAAMVCGKPEIKPQQSSKGKKEILPHLNSNSLQQLILQSKVIISRSGYSTIMDLVSLGKKAVFIPTPGQTEQEYLGRYFMEKGIYLSCAQEKFDLKQALDQSGDYSGTHIPNDRSVLKDRISQFLNRI